MSITEVSTRETFADAGAERMVISSILATPDLLIDASVKLREEDFLTPHHRALYSLLKRLEVEGITHFDLATVANELESRKLTQIVGGPEYISTLFSHYTQRENFNVYVNKILDCSTKYKALRQVKISEEKLLNNAGPSEDNIPATKLLDEMESSLLDISMQSRQLEDAVDIGEGLEERLRKLIENPVDIVGLTTGIPLLDDSINGLTPGSLTVVAARQKGGKSTLLMNMAANLAFRKGIPILYMDTEMTFNEMQTRLLAHLAQVPERAIATGQYINNQRWAENVGKACVLIKRGKFLHKYMPGYTIEAVKSVTRKNHSRKNIGAFFFDYIKLPEVGNSDSFKEHQILGNVTTSLKDLAGKLNIPGIAAAQIKRGEGAVPKSRFHDSDVADSDRIGRYCNNLITIAAKSKKEQEEEGASCGTHRLQILLARGGTPNFYGIDLECNMPRLTMTQAHHQFSGVATPTERDEF